MNEQPRHKLLEHRTSSGLSQDEMAFLLGVSTGSRVSRYESSRRMPQLEQALAYVAVHQRPLHQLLDGKYVEVVRSVLVRAKQLQERFEQDGVTGRKVERLRTLVLVLERGLQEQDD